MSANVLIIDDDEELCALLSDFLALEGFVTHGIHDGAQAVTHCREHHYDALVLDIMLPGLQGLDVLRQVRQFSTTPILMLTARGEDTDRILGLELGADDYLPKPCNPRELSARLRAILRRAKPTAEDKAPPLLEAGHIMVDPANRSATLGGDNLQLTSAEFNVLQVLVANAGTLVPKELLSQNALGRALSAYDRSIDVHISKIRRKLAIRGGDNLIVSVRGSGYQLRTGSEMPAP
jgi:DNA-binding response OmpR family regulator